MIVRSHKAWLQIPIRCDPEAVTESTEFCIVKRADNFYLSPIQAVFLPVVHPPGDDLF